MWSFFSTGKTPTSLFYDCSSDSNYCNIFAEGRKEKEHKWDFSYLPRPKSLKKFIYNHLFLGNLRWLVVKQAQGPEFKTPTPSKQTKTQLVI
jgi:hypothetical protein